MANEAKGSNNNWKEEANQERLEAAVSTHSNKSDNDSNRRGHGHG